MTLVQVAASRFKLEIKTDVTVSWFKKKKKNEVSQTQPIDPPPPQMEKQFSSEHKKIALF